MYTKCSKELSEDVLIGQSQAPKELARDRDYFKNKDHIVEHQGKLLRILLLHINNGLVFLCYREERFQLGLGPGKKLDMRHFLWENALETDTLGNSLYAEFTAF